MNPELEPSSLNSDIRNAGKKIVYFVRKYDDLHLSLACHAAFPLVLTPDLLYQIWAEFVREVPWVSVAHLLLSPLCREVSYEVFEMELSVRNLLLEELEGREGQGRLKKLADFMIAYVEKFLVGYDADTENLRERHTLISLAYTEPNEAARRLAQKLSDGVKTTDVREAFRWTTLGKTLVTPLGKAGFKPLLTYNELLFHYARGEIHQHQALVEAFGQEKQQLEGRLAIGELKLPDDVSRLLPRTPISVPVTVQSPPSLHWQMKTDIVLQSFSIEVAMIVFDFKYRALAWDEHPEELLLLKEFLQKHHEIELEITNDEGDFFYNYNSKPWDFLILEPTGYGRRFGLKLATRIRELDKEIPIVFLTTDDSIIINDEINIVQPILIKSKALTQGILAYDIFHYIENIKKSRENYDYSKVFIIYGHGKHAAGFKDKVIDRLEEHGVEPVLLAPEQVMNSIGEGLVNQMKSCGAFLAICTPDDKVDDNWYQPRQNVTLQIGMALGFSEGFKRLIILQRWGLQPQYQAKLPSDLGGILSLQFHGDAQEETFEKLIKALKERKITINEN
jgi:predicted nucleotide-binding protein